MKKLSLSIPGYGTINAPAGIQETGTTSDIATFIRDGLTIVLNFSIIIALIFLVYGGIKWTTSGGDKAAVESARKIITYAIFGLVLVFSSWLILNFVTSMFGVRYTPLPPSPYGP